MASKHRARRDARSEARKRALPVGAAGFGGRAPIKIKGECLLC